VSAMKKRLEKEAMEQGDTIDLCFDWMLCSFVCVLYNRTVITSYDALSTIRGDEVEDRLYVTC
jgi:hypothetical protein